MDVRALIEAKRDGRAHSSDDLRALARGAADGSIPDYQLAAWLMAAYLRGLSPQETADLTLAMAESGERLDLTGLPKPWLDKHSTGGVGDKTTLVVLPVLAACGLTVVKMSGRGLGVTGGTIDKLESVPGFRTDLSPEEMKDQAARIGVALTGQTPRLAPADKALYALRDVTGTVASVPLITASVLSKKIAGGAETVVLDVKCGSGGFMHSPAEATALAESLVRVGSLAGLTVRALVTDMDQPLGAAVGNALEVKEALAVLAGSRSARWSGGPTARFRDLCLTLAGQALEAVGRGDRATAEEVLASGAALSKARTWFEAQGADPSVFDREDWLCAPVVVTVPAPASGFLSRLDAREVGEAALGLGAGRATKADTIDPRVGLVLRASVGERVERGEPLIEVHAATTEAAAAVATRLASAVSVSPDPVTPPPLVLSRIEGPRTGG